MGQRKVVGARVALLGLLLSGCPASEPPANADGGADLRMEADLSQSDLSLEPPVLPEVLVRGASFRMGTAPDGGGFGNESPEHTVTIEPFYLDVHEVTVEAYGKCLAARVCAATTGCTATDKPMDPMTCVRWVDAATFCGWVKRRLPTEEEWEYAARGATTPKAEYPWGSTAPAGQLCWNRPGPCAVGSFPKTLFGAPSEKGVADLAGNALEWTSSEHVAYPNPRACTTESDQCIVRGGCYASTQPLALRAALRDFRPPPTAATGSDSAAPDPPEEVARGRPAYAGRSSVVASASMSPSRCQTSSMVPGHKR